MADNQNFEKDINVPHKEQIMIDGVNVSGCSYYNPLGNYNCGGTKKCSQWSNCYFKQLARKTQECERSRKRISDLEERIINHSNEIEEYCSRLADKNKKCEKYEQALDEFELLITNHISSCEKCPDNKNGYCIGIDECSSRCLKKILDIINKAKDGNDE